MPDADPLGQLPEFDAPPVIEMSLGVQFVQLPSLRTLELASLREVWRDRYPHTVEQPPLPPMIESAAQGPTSQFMFGVMSNRAWFLTADEAEVVQVQTDRLAVNWRRQLDAHPYPRYDPMRTTFAARYVELVDFVRAQGGTEPSIRQAEVTYVNEISVGSGSAGLLQEVVVGAATPLINLGLPRQAQAAWSYELSDVGATPTRLYLQVAPTDPAGRPGFFITLTVRGAPADTSLAGTLDFFDRAHACVVRAFADATPQARHEDWGRTR